MDKQPPLAGLDPADLLRQGMAEDTLAEEASPAFTPPPPAELAPLFPQFEILELIGQGGMGAVYKVRQKDLDRIVALKILPPAIGRSPEFSNRFTREARALAKLNHPGIVTIHEFGQQDGLYYILMEFVDGVNLAQLMKTGRISPREALAIVPQICDALQYAHDQGIVHRDIKPENILLDRLGRVKVADFGIAKVLAAVCEDPERSGGPSVPTDATIAGKIIGTPAYMAPEQLNHPSDVDHRADIFALGVVFYQMLTGELPDKRLEAPSKKVHIDVRLDEIVLQAMEKDPEMRFQQASILKTQVETLGESATPPEITAGDPVPSAKKPRSTGSMIAIGCGVILLLGAIGVVMASIALFWFLRPSSGQVSARQVSDAIHREDDMRSVPPDGKSAARVTGTLVLPKEFSETQQAAVARAALDLLASCGLSEGSSVSDMFQAKNGIAHIWITFPEGLGGSHPDEMLITFPLTSGSVWTRRANKYERHAKFTPAAAVALSTALGHEPSAAFAESAGLPVKDALAAAQTWLAGVDAGNYAQSWKTAAMFFQKAITENGWSAALAKGRKPLGEMKSRKLLDAKSAKSLPGAPDGEYVVMQFETSFAAKEKAVETVTFMKEPDGTWKAAGYFIR